MASPKPHGRTHSSAPDVQGLGARLVTAREGAELSRRSAADALGWSPNRLRSYESSDTCPTVEDLATLAALYSVDPVALAFGGVAGGGGWTANGTSDADGVRWVSHVDGPAFGVPARVVQGLPGPLEAIDVVSPQPGVGVYQRGVLPPPAGGWAIVSSARGAQVMWVWRASSRWWAHTDPVAARQALKPDMVLGRLAVLLSRVL